MVCPAHNSLFMVGYLRAWCKIWGDVSALVVKSTFAVSVCVKVNYLSFLCFCLSELTVVIVDAI